MAKLYFKVASDWEEVVRLRNEISKLKQELKNMDSTQSPATFKTLNTQLAASTQQLDGLVTEAAKAGAEMENGFKKKIFDASQSVNDFTQKIINQKAVVKDVEADVKRLGEAYRIALKRNPLSADGKLREYNSARKALDEEKAALFGLTQEQANARLSVKKLRDEYSLYNKEAGSTVQANENMALSLSKVLGVIGGVAALKKLGSEIIRVRGEFQSMQTAIETLVGKDVAGKLMPQIKELAKISPLTMTDMVGAEKMMLGFNIQAEDTIKYLKALSDLSMGESGKFNSLTLAFSQMSAAGKLMGQDLNQMINAGFNPLQTISEKTGKSIAQLKNEMFKGALSAEMVQQAFLDATSAGGKFYNMSENASKTINGQISMMQDALDNAFNEMGQKSEGVIMSGIQATTSLIQNYETVGKVLIGLIATYGTYRTAVMLSTIATSKHTIAETALTNVRVLARRAQVALNAAMLTNPYVLLATAVVGLGAAMWAMSDGTSTAERAQKEYNKTKEEAAKNEETHRQEIDKLLSSARDESLATLTRQKSLEELRKEYPKIFEQYDLEKLKLADILKLKQQINEEDSKLSVQGRKDDYSSLKETVSNQQRYLQLFDNPDLRKDMSDKDKEIWKMFAGNQSYVQVREEMQKNAEKLKLLQKDVLKDNIAAYKANLKNYSKEKLEAELKMAQSSASKRNGFNIGGMMVKGTDLEGLVSSINGALTEKKSSSTYKEDYEKAKKDWEGAKKVLSEIEKDKSKFTSKQYEEAKKRKETAEKTYKDLGGVTGGSLTKQENQAEKFRKEQEKYKVLLSKRQLEQIRSEEDLQMQVDEVRIKVMDEGSEKTIAQMKHNFEKELQAIDRQKEDTLRKKIENARSAFEANPDNKKKSFDASGVELTDTENSYFDSLYKIAIANNEKVYSDLANMYLSYTDERLAIEKKFNDDIAVLQESRKKAEAKGDTDEVAKIDRSIAKATADKGKELMKHDFDVLKQSPEYIRAFEDLRNTSSETLSSLLKQLENAKHTAAQTLNPEDLREYTTTIQEIMNELDARNPFQALADRQKELAEAEQELAKAKKELDTVNSGGKVESGSKLNNETGKIDKTYLSAAQALTRYNAAKDKAQKANNNFIKAENTAREKVDELADAIIGIGNAIGGKAGEIISLMGDVALFATCTIDGISKVAQTGANAISAVEKASVILGIISAGIQLMQQLNSILPTADNQYEKYADKIAEINKLTDAVNEYRIAALEAQQAESNWFSDDNLKNLRDYKKLHDEVAEAYKNKAGESQAIYQNKSGGGWFTNSWNWLLDNTYGKIYGIDFARKYEEGQTAAVNNLRIETRSRKKGFLGSGIGGRSQKTEDLVSWARNNGFGELFDNEGLINKDAANAILNQYGDKLVGQTKETLESLVELREKYDEYIEQLHEYVSSLYEPLVDNFVDSLWSWLDSGKDALDSFKDYASDTFRDIVSDMMRTIVLDKIVGSFSDDIAALYEEYAKGAINETELMKKVAERTNGLVGDYESNIPTLQNIMEQVNGYLQGAGIDLKQTESTSQSATSKGFQTMSQDTGEELNGRFTALQIAGEEIKNQAIVQTGLLSSINEKISLLDLTNENFPMLTSPDAPNIADQTREAIANNYQSQVNIIFPTDRIESLAADVFTLKVTLDEMRTLQIEKFNDVAEGVAKMAKNTPMVNTKLDSINDNIKKAL